MCLKSNIFQVILKACGCVCVCVKMENLEWLIICPEADARNILQPDRKSTMEKNI